MQAAGDEFAASGDDTDNSGSYGGQLRPIEILSSDLPDAAPGYVDQSEPSCAYCMLQNTIGATYVHWGMNNCPAGHKLLYSGYMVGPYGDNVAQNGGGSNFLCLNEFTPADHNYDGSNSGQISDSVAHLVRVEYATALPLFLSELRDYDAVCSLCQTPGREWGLTVPGRQTCPTGFTPDYTGYLMAEHYLSNYKAEHICVAADASTQGSFVGETFAPYDFGANGAEDLVVTVDGVDKWIQFSTTAQGADAAAACARINQVLSAAVGVCTVLDGKLKITSATSGASSTVRIKSLPGCTGATGGTMQKRVGHAICVDSANFQQVAFNPTTYWSGQYHYWQYVGQAVGEARCLADLRCNAFSIPKANLASGSNPGIKVYPECGILPDMSNLHYLYEKVCPANSVTNANAVGMFTSGGSGTASDGRSSSAPKGRCETQTTQTQSSSLHLVETDGELPGYTDGSEVTCVQCSSNLGPTYVRWGRSTCPLATSLVYTGHAAGAHVLHTGGGYNYQCLHNAPEYAETAAGQSNTGARLYRVEYETANKGLSRLWGVDGSSVPCVVCQAVGALSTMMQPGDATCPQGWSVEYDGYVMSSPSYHSLAGAQRTEYVCLDQDAEVVETGQGTGALSARFSPVEVYADTRATANDHIPGNSNSIPGYSTFAASTRKWSSGHELACKICSKPVEAIRCPDIDPPDNSTLVCDNGVAWGSTCTFSCAAGLVLYGPRALRCTDELQSAAVPAVPEACVPAAVTTPPTDCQTLFQPGSSATCPDGCTYTAPVAAIPAAYRWNQDPNRTACVTSLAESTDVYTRFGADNCGHDEVIYTGTMAGPGPLAADINDQGGGANHLCLVDSPIDTQPYDLEQREFGAQLQYSANRRNRQDPDSPKLFETFYETSRWDRVPDFGDRNGDGDFTNDYPLLISSTHLGIACAVCKRARAAGVTLYGTNQCPVGSVSAYSGFLGAGGYHSPGHRTTFECMELEKPAVVKQDCRPTLECPDDGTKVTSFRFDEYEQLYGGTTATLDFFDSRIGGTIGSGWAWAERAAGGLGLTCDTTACRVKEAQNQACTRNDCLVNAVSTGEFVGVLERTSDSGEATVFTKCLFDTADIKIKLDLLARKGTADTTFKVSVDNVLYAEMTIPGDAAATSVTATIETFQEAKTSTTEATTGTRNNQATDVVWTESWELEISLPTKPADRVDLSFTHQGPGDVAIDNVLITGGVCGTPTACVCSGYTTNAQGGRRLRNPAIGTANGVSYIQPVEVSQDVAAAPGYNPGREIACGHCHVENANGNVYVRFGASTCPTGHQTIGTGRIVGTPSYRGDGGAQYLCLDTYFSEIGDSSNTQNSGNGMKMLARVEYIDDGSQPLLSGKHQYDASCSVCQAPDRAWGVMIPGRRSCPSGFTADYSGFLMTEVGGNRNVRPTGGQEFGSPRGVSEHICVDGKFDGSSSSTGGALHETHQNNNARLALIELDPVYGDPSAMGYITGREVTCVQCSSNSGPTYVRWGRRSCPPSTVEVYVGHAANGRSRAATGRYQDSGSTSATDSYGALQGVGYNFVCLHGEPEYDAMNDHWLDITRTGELLFRVEYAVQESNLWRMWDLQDEDVPCSVCQSTGSLATMMQPGSSVCPVGWSAEYVGYIMAEPESSYRRTENICVDGNPEKDEWSDALFNHGSRLSPVEIRSVDKTADALEQPFDIDMLESHGYKDYQELRCAVCSLPNPALGSCAAPIAYPRSGNGNITCTNEGLPGSKCLLQCNKGFTPMATATCLGDNDGTVPAVCSGNDDGAGSPCTLNQDGTACAVEAGSCIFSPRSGDPCALNADASACAVATGDCSFTAKPTLQMETTCLPSRQWDFDAVHWQCEGESPDKISTDVYVRWGSQICDEAETLLYAGVAVGPSWNDPGSGANHLCLSRDSVDTAGPYKRSAGGDDDCSSCAGCDCLAAAMAGRGGLVFPVKYKTKQYGIVSDDEATLSQYYAVDQFSMACTVCARKKSSTVTVYGSSECPVGLEATYTGHVGIPDEQVSHHGGRGTHMCVDEDAAVSRDQTCDPVTECDGGQLTLTLFNFASRDSRDGKAAPENRQPKDFVDYVNTGGTGPNGPRAVGTIPDGDGWEWISSLGDHEGVLHRTTDLGAGRIFTDCAFDTKNIVISMDILPRKFHQESEFILSIGDVDYAKLVIPGSTDTSQTDVVEIELLNDALSNLRDGDINTGLSNADLVWTTGWELTLSLPDNLVGTSVKLAFTHIAAESGTSTSDVALDNVVVKGGICGTGFACTCLPGDDFARAGMVTTTSHTSSASGARMQLAETFGKHLLPTNNLPLWYQTNSQETAAPGYRTGDEIPCTRCSQKSRVGAIYTQWGKDTCPTGHALIHAGHMLGSMSEYADSKSRGASNFMCVITQAERTLKEWSNGFDPPAQYNRIQSGGPSYNLFSAGLVKTEIADSLPTWMNHIKNQIVVCSVCQAPERAWSLTVPGRPDCPTGFNVDYSGYLMASSDHGPVDSSVSLVMRSAKSEYVCVTLPAPLSDAIQDSGTSWSLTIGDATFVNDDLGVSTTAPSPLGVEINAQTFHDFGRTVPGANNANANSNSPTPAQRLNGYGNILDLSSYNVGSRDSGNHMGARMNPNVPVGRSEDDYKLALVMMGYRKAGIPEPSPAGCSAIGYNAASPVCDATEATSYTNAAYIEPVNVKLNDLTVGQKYRLQLMFYDFEAAHPKNTACSTVAGNGLPSFATLGPWKAENYFTAADNVPTARTICNGARGFDVLFDGVLIVDEFSPIEEQTGRSVMSPSYADESGDGDPLKWRVGTGSPGVVITYDFVATNTAATVSLDGTDPSCLDTPYRACPPLDVNGNSRYDRRQGMINALTLEELNAGTVLESAPSIGIFRGGDLGDGLDLQGSFKYAVMAGPRVGAISPRQHDVDSQHSASRLHMTEIASDPDLDIGLGPSGERYLIPGYTDGAEITCAQCSSNAGPTFVRWGRRDCPASSTLLYAGLAAGGGSGRHVALFNQAQASFNALSGNGYNYQCLHETPQYSRTEAGANLRGGKDQTGGAKLFAVEYETARDGVGHDTWQLWHLHDHEMPCAVCQSTGSLAVFTQTGSETCPTGWSVGYRGLIMSSPTSARSDMTSGSTVRATSRSEFICVDGEAQPSVASDPRDNSRDAGGYDGFLMVIAPVELGSRDNFGERRNAELKCATCLLPQDISCGIVTAPAHGTAICTNADLFGSDCSFGCKKGFVMQGSPLISCLDTGAWSAPPTSTTCVASNAVASDVYVRWGADSCAELDTKLYAGQGRVVGARHSDTGSGANYLCLVPDSVAVEDGVSSRPEGGGAVWSVEHGMSPNVPGVSATYPKDIFGEFATIDKQEEVCSVCVRNKASGVTLWGTDKCPDLSVHAYDGYIMAAEGLQRSVFQCVDKSETAVARSLCLPRAACPTDGSKMTSFRFDYNVPNDFSDTQQDGWRWATTVGGTSTQRGVFIRDTDSGTGSIETQCSFDTRDIKVKIDIMPRKWYKDATFDVVIDGATYASVLIPGNEQLGTVLLQEVCNLTLAENTSSNKPYLLTGINHNDLYWESDWELSIRLPEKPTKPATFSFVHTGAPSGQAGDVAIDNVFVTGGICGSYSTCTCQHGSQYAAAGNQRNQARNEGARVMLAETRDADVAGYLDNVELTCAHCHVESSVGGIFDLFGTQKCPVNTREVSVGVMMGTNEGQDTTIRHFGASNFICAGVEGRMSLDKFDTSIQGGPSVGAVVFGATSPAFAAMYPVGAAITCATCQATGRGWTLMIPGRNDCPNGFDREATGYLLAAHHEMPPARTPAITMSITQRSQFTCVVVDSPVPTTASASRFASRLFVTETAGRLPGYTDGKEVTCALCSSNAGPTYVRWGRTTCPTASDLVYSGYAAGSHYEETGGGYNLVCLHETPVYGTTEDTVDDNVAKLYRVEFETEDKGLWKMWGLHNADVACAVCQPTGSIAVLMQPGSAVCPTGWSTEYEGFIMAAPSHTSQHRRSEYVCVDSTPEAVGDPADNSIEDHSSTLNDLCIAAAADRDTCEAVTPRGACTFVPGAPDACIRTIPNGAALLAPVEVKHTPNDQLPGYTQFAELRCAECSQPIESIQCPVLHVPDHGSYKCTNKEYFASECTYSCDRGYLLCAATEVPSCAAANADEATCLSAGACMFIPGANGAADTCTTALDAACNGPDSVTCTATAEWSPAPAVTCVLPAQVSTDSYVKWGGSQCHVSDDEIYSGRAVGQQTLAPNSQDGSAGNRLCLHPIATDDGTSRGQNYGDAPPIYSLEYNTLAYDNVDGFETAAQVNNYEVPCLMCSRARAEGFDIWGSSQCPSNSVPSVHSYSGYAMADVGTGRTDFVCVQRDNAAVARSPCEPLRSCAADGSVSTFFKFDRPGNTNDNDFIDRSTGEYTSSTTPASPPWTFVDDPSSTDANDWLFQRIADTGSADITTACTFSSSNVTISMRVAPLKNTNGASFRVSINGIEYVKLTIPGTTDTTTAADANVDLFNGATSDAHIIEECFATDPSANPPTDCATDFVKGTVAVPSTTCPVGCTYIPPRDNVILTGLDNNDVAWTRWSIRIPLPAVVLTSANSIPLSFTHTVENGATTAAADILIDDVDIVGGQCGSKQACQCSGRSEFAAAGDDTDNNQAELHIVEGKCFH